MHDALSSLEEVQDNKNERIMKRKAMQGNVCVMEEDPILYRCKSYSAKPSSFYVFSHYFP